jgi:EAL domain-containing protein (putative c-di-GMP-specific phosphodiesterase class I)
MGVAFQPVVSTTDGSVLAYEALMRCRVPGLESPPALLDRAGAEGAVGYVGRLVREVAFARASDVALFVNIHPDELSSRWLVRPDDPLNLHGHPVYLEIPARDVFWQFDLCGSVLAELCRRAGARLAVDDFGAGQSNLERVLELEPAVVKLDVALIRGIHAHSRKQVVVRHLVRLFEELGSLVVAEGVETPDELDCVGQLGVHYAQGFLFGRPSPDLLPVAWPVEPRASVGAVPMCERPTERPEATSNDVRLHDMVTVRPDAKA